MNNAKEINKSYITLVPKKKNGSISYYSGLFM